VATLEKLAIPYALIGGLAVSARGAFRATKDVDLLLGRHVDEASELALSLKSEGLAAEVHKGAFDDPLPGLIRVTIREGKTAVRCDLLFPFASWQFGVVKRATAADVGGFAVRLAQAEDLFLLKLQAGGPMDLFDAAQLYQLQPNNERHRWEKRAAEIRMLRAFARAMKFLRPRQK
jgi:hypothetical protein